MKIDNRVLCICLLMSIMVDISSCVSLPDGQNSNLYRVSIRGKYGFINEQGKIVIEPIFDDAYHSFFDGRCYARVNDRCGVIDTSGSFIHIFPDSLMGRAFHISNGVIGISGNGMMFNMGGERMWGFIGTRLVDYDGRVLYSANCDVDVILNDGDYYFAEYYYGDWELDKSLDIINSKGLVVGEPCDSILGGSQGLFAIKRNGKWGYMNTRGEMVIDAIYDYARIFSDCGMARVIKDNKHFFIDKNGQVVLEVDKTLTGFGCCNRAAVILNGRKCLIDINGNKICDINADRIITFENDGLATIINNNMASKIDTLGNVVLQTNYENVGKFINNVAVVSKDGKIGYIDLSGKEIIPVQYEYKRTIKETDTIIAVSKNNSEWEYYDFQGNLIWRDIPKQENLSQPIGYNDRESWIEYFDSRLSELDPIEGLYYVTNKHYYQDRDNLSSIGLNNTASNFFAVAKGGNKEFYAHCIDQPGMSWVNKFVRIGESNNYAIMKVEEDSDYSSEGRVLVEDVYQFDFRLEQGHNSWYNFFVTYEFVKDYPAKSEYEKLAKAEWTGSGFAIADGYIVTNYHVTSGANSIFVRGVNGEMNERYKCVVVANDKEHDMSIIKIVDKDFDGIGKIPYKIGNTFAEVGDDIFVLGYPQTLTMGEEIKLTTGVISSSSGFKGNDSLWQISAAIQPGNSGGPVCDAEGTVIGIVCGKHSDAENANYAVKVAHLYNLVSSSEIGIDLTKTKHVNTRKLSKQVNIIKDFVYLIECSSK